MDGSCRKKKSQKLSIKQLKFIFQDYLFKKITLPKLYWIIRLKQKEPVDHIVLSYLFNCGPYNGIIET